MTKPKVLVFASGTSSGGGSGFENLLHKSREGVLDADIVGVVSNHENGGVALRAARLGVPFYYFRPPWTAAGYVLLARETEAEFFALSGWLKLVKGLDPRRTFNIHPGPLPTFGGPGMHGHHVHTAVMEAYRSHVLDHTAVCMHFVTGKYDQGPVFFRHLVSIHASDTPQTIAARANDVEHRWQPEITNLVVHREIHWNGQDPGSLKIPNGYRILRPLWC